MTQQTEALRLALEALKNNRRTHHYCEDTWYSCPKHEDGCANDSEGDECNCGADEANAEIEQAIAAIKSALEAKDEPVAIYGYCPVCGAKGTSRERHPDGNTTCVNGHKYKSRDTLSAPPQQEAKDEPVAWEAIEKVAQKRYKVMPSDASMFYRFAVVAGDGNQQLFIGRYTECQVMAKKFTGAFLDGAFLLEQMTNPPQQEAKYEPVAIKWEKDADKECRYNNWVGMTPFGRILITWKGWKEWHDACVDEFPGGFEAYGLPDDVKAACEVEYLRRLYTTSPQRKPLTDEEIMDALKLKSCDGYRAIVRAIEAAHGIK